MKKLIIAISILLFTLNASAHNTGFYFTPEPLQDYVRVVDTAGDTARLYCYPLSDNGKDSLYVKWNWYIYVDGKPTRGYLGNNYIIGADYDKYKQNNYYIFIYEARLLKLTIVN